MGRHRKLLILFLVLVVTAATGFVVYHYYVAQPPRAVLLLPDGNFLFYLNFAPAHFFDFGKLPVETEPEYQDFVDKTGFRFEHDLDTIAVSQTNPGDPSVSDSAAVFTGHFDQAKLSNYLRKLAGDTESYANKTVYSLANGDHVVRACIVDASTVAVTTGQSPAGMHSIIDKAGNFQITAKGPALAESYYRYVPFGSLSWVMVRMPSNLGDAKLPDGMSLDFLQNTVSIASVRYTVSIRLKLEVFSTNDGNARKVTEAVSSLLALGRSATQSLSPSGTDKDVKEVFDSIQVEQNKDRTVISLVIPQALINKLQSSMNR